MCTLEKNKYLSIMDSLYTNASNNTPSHTHVSSYVVWSVHPPWTVYGKQS